MPATHRKVRIVSGKDCGVPNVIPDVPVVMVDGKPLQGVTRIKFDHKYSEGRPVIEVTLVGVDIDYEGAPDYLVRVVGPKPPREEPTKED